MTYRTGVPWPARRMNEITRQRVARTVLELRSRGLTYRAIAVVLDLYEGVEMSPEQCRSWASHLGVPPDPNKVRAAQILNRMLQERENLAA